MEYINTIEGRFVSRPNRFIAHCQIGPDFNNTVVAHVKNTGRCKELLLPGAKVYLAKAANPQRKTGFDLIAVEKERVGDEPLLVNMDSQAPNQVLYEALEGGLVLPGQPGPWSLLKREQTFGKSRFDLYGEAGNDVQGETGHVFDGEVGNSGNSLWQAFIEVKGVTLEDQGVARFPDAPTTRGARHLEELILAKEAGYASYVVFVIQMKGLEYFTPHDERDPAFGLALRRAAAAGVKVLAYDCQVEPGKLELGAPVEVRL